jgi:hypothetical protein
MLTFIFLISGGLVSTETVKTNLVNAYYRYLSNSGDHISYYVNGVKLLNATRASNHATILEAINRTEIGQRSGNCVDWKLGVLDGVTNSKVYLVTDQSPCDQPRYIGRGNTVTSIGMGAGITQRALEQTCGPCSQFFGCVRGWNWFKIF